MKVLNGDSEIFYSKIRKDLKDMKGSRRNLIKSFILQSELMKDKELFSIFAELEYSVETFQHAENSSFFQRIVDIASNNQVQFIGLEGHIAPELIPVIKDEFTLGYLKISKDSKSEENFTNVRDIKNLLILFYDYLSASREIEKNFRKLEVLNNTTLIMNSSLNTDDVYKAFSQEIKKIIDFDRISIATIEEDNILVFGIDTSLETRLTKGVTISKENTAPSWVILNGKTHIAIDLQEKKEFLEDEMLVEEGMRSAIRVPLWVKGNVIGTLNLNSKRPHLYGHYEKLFLEQVGRQIATAIQNAQLFEEGEKKKAEIQSQNVRLETLNSLARAVGSSLDLDITLREALSKVVEIMGTEAGAIFLTDEETGQLKLKIHQGLFGDSVAQSDCKIINEGIASKVVKTGEPVVFYNGQVKQTGCLFNEKTNLKMVAYIPLKSKNKILGVMPIGTEKEIGVSNRDWEILVGIGNQIGVAIENAQLYQKIKHMAEFDGLTEIYNRRVFFRLLEQEISRAERYGPVFSLMMADVDLFKEYNDQYGHLAGDEALRVIADIMKESIRETDIVARYGGEEFIILSVNSTKEQTFEIAERIRKTIEDAGKEKAFPTISIGISSYPEDGMETDPLLRTADIALYLAKEKRNNCCMYQNDVFADIINEAK